MASHCTPNNFKRAVSTLLLAAALVGCFLWRFLMYAIGHPDAAEWRQRRDLYSWSLPIAKGFGQTNKLILALILLPISRNTVTYMRATPLRHVLYFNDAITVHQILGWLGLVSMAGHTIAHIVDYVHETARSRSGLWAAANPHEPQPTAASACSTQVVITGLIMWAVILIAYPFAVSLPRSFTSRWERLSNSVSAVPACGVLANHNWFYATHHLFVAFYVALILHPKPAIPNEYHEWLVSDTWVWVGLPVLIYVTERLVRGWRHYFWQVKVLAVKPMSGHVLEVKLSKPQGFSAVAGQYILLRCPQVSLFEWHPFSLTSAPQDPCLMVHIAAAGDWSRQLYALYEVKLASSNGVAFEFPQLIVDGPFGAPTQDHKHFQTLLLVGAGIGITPMVGVLKSLLAEHHAVVSASSDLEEGQAGSQDRCIVYWSVRDEGQMAWCTETLQDVLSRDAQGYLQVHVHVTGRSESFPSGSPHGHRLKQAGSEILLTWGRPVWPDVFARLASGGEHSVIGVFFCGPQQMANELRMVSRMVSQSTSTRFVFHQEHF